MRQDARGPGAIRATELGNGIQVLTESIAGVRSAAVGVWIRQGAAHEPEKLVGISHMLEHMAFKGTETRSPREIALALEGLGGSLDAYTSREHTSYQARVLDENVPEALDVLADLVINPTLRTEDLDREKDVVLEEISTVEDTPDDLVFELHGERLWAGHTYGNSILGTRDSVTSMTREDLVDLHGAAYAGSRIVVAAAGSVEHDEVLDQVEGLFGGLHAGTAPAPLDRPGPQTTGVDWLARDSAQTHIVLGSTTPGHSDPDRYAMVLLSSALGGGMSSRLFQRIREELALAYSVYSFQSFYSRAGLMGVYVGTRPAWARSAVEAISEELASVAERGLTEQELEQTKRQVKGQIMLSLESTGARLYRLVGFALYEEPFMSLDELLDNIDRVTVDDLARIGARVFAPDNRYVLCLGPQRED